MSMLNKIRERLQLDGTASRALVLSGQLEDNNLRTLIGTIKKSIIYVISFLLILFIFSYLYCAYNNSLVSYIGSSLMTLFSYYFGLKFFSAERYFRAKRLVDSFSVSERSSPIISDSLRKKDKVADSVNIAISAIMMIMSLFYGFMTL